jgi:hypothetical protein
MARPLRIEYKVVFYHITSRGNEEVGNSVDEFVDLLFQVIRGQVSV